MGAYEWNPTVDIKENSQLITQHSQLLIAPNPFSQQTTITARWDKSARVNIEIYNAAGLLVEPLQSGNQLPGNCQIPWNGTGNSGNLLPAGVYVVLLRTDGREVGSMKVVKE